MSTGIGGVLGRSLWARAVWWPKLMWRGPLVKISGVAEVVGGIGVLVPRTRRAAGWGLIALLWARLPLQAVLIAWVWWTSVSEPRHDSLE